MLMTLTHAPDLAAQGVPVELTDSIRAVHAHLVRSAELVPEEQFAFRPVDGVRTFLQLIAHAADGNHYYGSLASGEQVDWSDAVERSVGTKAGAVAALRASVAACEQALSRADARQAPLIEHLAHASLHYGNVIVYLRELGIVPPSTDTARRENTTD
jgi:uncharacterized damage-inducible protein DinB